MVAVKNLDSYVKYPVGYFVWKRLLSQNWKMNRFKGSAMWARAAGDYSFPLASYSHVITRMAILMDLVLYSCLNVFIDLEDQVFFEFDMCVLT